MKAKHIPIILLVILLVSGCFISRQNNNPSVVKLGSHFSVDNTSENRVLLSNVDALAASGLYYAAWGTGGKTPYENSDGETIDLYDAQIYLLFGEYSDSGTAAENMQSWLDAGRTNYEVIREDEIQFCGQVCMRLTYRFPDTDSPYTNGISIFGVLDNNAVCIELTCRDTFAGDPQAAMDEFLDCCTYAAD